MQKKLKYLIAASAALGLNAIIAAFLCGPPALAQTGADVAVRLEPEILSIIYSPADFTMDKVLISSPVTTYYSYYNNPGTVDPDGNPATRDGTAVRVQDGRFKGGFQLQAQVDTDYASGQDAIPRQNLGVRTGIGTGYGGSSESGTGAQTLIEETLTPGTAPASAPLEMAEDYTNFTSPLVLLDGATASCDEGRVGIYTVFPSFRLLVPNDTPAGTYTTSVTYTLLEEPAC